MAAAGQGNGISGWYSNADSSQSSDEILSTTFAHAKLLLRTALKPKDFDSLFPSTNSSSSQHVANHSIFDVQRCLRDVQASYECRVGHAANPFQELAPTIGASLATSSPTVFNKSKAKARVWLTGLSEKLLHYGNIFDVLIQHHPEYVSLAWGTFKLLFVAITNHAEVASKLSKSISQIADILPQHSLHMILYPTVQMQTSVARLYAHILNFFVSSLEWYKDHWIVHAFKSVVQPWDLKFRHEYEAIAAESTQIRRLADVAMKAEVRDTRLELVQGTKHWALMKEEMTELRAENQRLATLFQIKFGMMEDSMLCMYKEIRLDFKSQRSTLNRVHLNQMLSLPLWNSLPTSGESLQFCRSMRNRRRERTRMPLPDVKRLESWSSQRNNTLLLIDTHIPTVAKTFMVDLIDFILDNQMPIIWALRYGDYWDKRTNATDVIRMLVLQTMQLAAQQLLESPFPLTVEHLREAASLNDWVAMLNRLLATMSHAFIVLDADLLSHATVHERSEVLEILDTLRLELSGNVKIVTATSSVSRSYAEELKQSNACVKIQLGGGDWRKPRRQRRPLVQYRKTRR